MKTPLEWEEYFRGRIANRGMFTMVMQDVTDEVSAKYEARIVLLNDTIDQLNDQIEGLYQDMKGEDV